MEVMNGYFITEKLILLEIEMRLCPVRIRKLMIFYHPHMVPVRPKAVVLFVHVIDKYLFLLILFSVMYQRIKMK